jgi:hypothetical protein
MSKIEFLTQAKSIDWWGELVRIVASAWASMFG